LTRALGCAADLLFAARWQNADASTGQDIGRRGAASSSADHVQANAQVEAIDYSARTVVLKGEGGRVIELKVGPSAKNFDQVKVGDNVKANL
jgi:hypothetical protein